MTLTPTATLDKTQHQAKPQLTLETSHEETSIKSIDSISDVASKVMKESDFMNFFEPETLEKIRKLIPYNKTNSTQKTISPTKFLENLALEQMPENPLTEEDIKQIYTMMSSHPLSDKITFYAIFGLEFSYMLETLKTLKNFISQEDLNSFEERWSAIYINHHRFIVSSSKVDPQVIKNFTTKLKKTLKDGLRKKLPNPLEAGSSRARLMNAMYKKFEAEYNSKVLAFLKKWDENCNLLNKFLSHNKFKYLLHEVHLDSCLGISETMQFSSEDDMLQATKHFRKYIKFITDSIRALNKKPTTPNAFNPNISPRFLDMFEHIEREMELQTFDKIKDPENDKIQCRNLLKLICENILELRNYVENFLNDSKLKDTPMEIQSGLLYCCAIWMKDFYNILQFSIIPIVIPKDRSDEAYERRIFFNLGSLTMNLKTELLSINMMPCPQWFKSVYSKFTFEFFSIYPLVTEISITIGKCNKFNLRPFQMIVAGIRKFYSKLKPLTEGILNELYENAKKNPDELKELPLLDMTSALAQALIVVNDIDALFDEQGDWPYELPQKYLQFIGIEKEIENTEKSPSIQKPEEDEIPIQNDLESDFSRLEVNEPPKLPSLEIKEPSSLTSKKPVSKSKNHENSKPLHCQSTSETSKQTYKEISDDFNLDTKNLYQLNRALRKLNLVRIEGKKHAKWLYPGSDLVATMGPRHGTPKKGLKKAMKNQILNNITIVNQKITQPPTLQSKTIRKKNNAKVSKRR